MVRIGAIGDGGKWLCNPAKIREFKEPCVVYSLGLNQEISFDVDFQNFTGKRCVLRAFDRVKMVLFWNILRYHF